MTAHRDQRPPRPFVVTSVSQGGAGGTVTSGRLAVALTAIGKKVLLIDFDLWRPGLWISMALEEEIASPVEDVLFGDTPASLCPVNLTGPLRARMEFHRSHGGHAVEFHSDGMLFAASPSLNSAFKVPPVGDPQIGKGLDRLMSAAASLCSTGVDIIVIDSPPGLSPLSVAAMEKAHLVLLCYRLCRQHVFSVGRLSKFLRWEYYAKKDVASVVLEHGDHAGANQLDMWFMEYLRQAVPQELAPLFYSVPYNAAIARDESFNLIDATTSAPYHELARLLLGRIDLFAERSQQRMGFDDITCSVESMQVPKHPV